MTSETDSGVGEVPEPPSLPTDQVRRIMWRLADRGDLQQLVSAARRVARGEAARLVALGARNTPEWTDAKDRLLDALDEAGLSGLVLDPRYGGSIEGPKNLATALAAFELAWVDGGAAACLLALALALAPILEMGTPDQKRTYSRRCAPTSAGGGRRPSRGAFCLTEPLPYVGVHTQSLGGKARVFQWAPGREPTLQIEKRGRFTTNMDFADFVVAAVESDDRRIEGSFLIILQQDDDGLFDRGAVAHKMAHQLSSTRHPVFQLKAPASRIVGGYAIRGEVLVPNHDLSTILKAVFGRTRVGVAATTAAKLLSAVEPIVRYQRERFRGGRAGPGTPQHEQGLQIKEDALHRLVDVWATGEAAASLAFAAARHFDACDRSQPAPGQPQAEDGSTPRGPGRAARKRAETLALEQLALAAQPEGEQDEQRLAQLRSQPLVQRLIQQSVADVLSPAAKLWNTGHGADMLREAVSLMGGCGVTEECPGFLPQKWMDAQLDAVYEGPESVQRRQLIVTMTSDLFLAQMRQWASRMTAIASQRPGSGACTVASAMDLWLWTLQHLRRGADADGQPLYRDKRQGATFPMADALCWLLAAQCQILDVRELESQAEKNPRLAATLHGAVQLLTDLCHVQAARTAGEIGRICGELVFGYHRHPSWRPECDACVPANEIDALEGLMPGLSVGVRMTGDVLEADGTHADKAGPCVRFAGLEEFVRRRSKLDGCLTGARLAKDRAARTIAQLQIPESLDYPRDESAV